MGWLKRMKDIVNEDAIEDIAGEIAVAVRTIYGGMAPGVIVTAPCPRDSAFKGVEHFASKIAEAVAEKVEGEYMRIFEPMAANRAGHHPRRRLEDDRVIALTQGARTEQLMRGRRILLIDDVATSGETMETHIKFLRGLGANVSGLVWLYGETREFGRIVNQ